MILKHRGIEPNVHSSVYVAPNAVIAGKVVVKAESRVMYGAVLDSEASRVEIGKCSIMCENAVIRATAQPPDADYPVLCGDHVFIGPHATLLGCAIESYSYIATGATILHGAVIRSGAIVGVAALVHARAVVPEGFFVPPHAVAMGDPLKLYGPEDGSALVDAIKAIGFTKTAFGVKPRSSDRASVMREITRVRSREFASHLADEIT